MMLSRLTNLKLKFSIDSLVDFCESSRMSSSMRKIIAVLLAIWLPLFSGSALASSVAMQMQHGACHEMAAMQEMDGHHHADAESSSVDHSSNQHGNCGVCHLACGGYLGVQEIKTVAKQQLDDSVTPYLFSFNSVISTPLLPPPLRSI